MARVLIVDPDLDVCETWQHEVAAIPDFREAEEPLGHVARPLLPSITEAYSDRRSTPRA